MATDAFGRLLVSKLQKFSVFRNGTLAGAIALAVVLLGSRVRAELVSEFRGAGASEQLVTVQALSEGVAGQGTDDASAVPELKAAIRAFRLGKVDETLTHLAAARQKQGQLPAERVMLAKLLIGQGEIPSARRVLEQAAVAEPRDPGVHLAFGELALRESRLADGQLHFERARELLPRTQWTSRRRRWFEARCVRGLAVIAESRARWEVAQDHWRHALELFPKRGPWRQRLARCLFELGDPGVAHKALLQAVRDHPTLEPPPLTMARFYSRTDDADKTEHWLRTAVQDFPADATASYSFASWLFDQGRLSEAKDLAAAAAKLSPDQRSIRHLRGLIAFQETDWDLAEQIFAELHRQRPTEFAASNQLALALVEQKTDEKATRALQLAAANVQRNPQLAEAFATYGWVCFRLGRSEEAERALRTAISSGRSNSDTIYYLARVLMERQQMKQARVMLAEALKAPGRFVHRADAQSRLQQLRSEEP